LSPSIGYFQTPKTTAVGTVTPQSGGQLSSDGDAVNVVFPVGAVTSTASLSYTMLGDVQQNRMGLRYAGRAFVLKAMADGQPITSFQKPFTLTLQYDPADLLFEKISNPQFLNVYFWRENKWQSLLPCAGCFVDAANNRIVVVLDHLTEFMLAAPIEAKVHLPITTK
jgi:hypothetical protein